jgi:hypothetical protein
MHYKKITSWEEACKVNGVDPSKLPDVSMIPVKFQNWLIATYKLGVITEAINTNEDGKIWTPDYNNPDQWKYFPYFEVEATESNPSGVGFSRSGYGDWDASAGVGSRLCFETREQVYHIQEHFKELFIQFHLIQE